MTLNPSDRYTAGPDSQRMLRLEPRQLLAHEVPLEQHRALRRPAARPPGRRQARRHVRRRCRASRTWASTRSRSPSRARAGERIAVHVPRQADPRRQHDVGVRAGRIQPTHAAVRQQREVERHSSTLIRSRSCAADLELLLLDRAPQLLAQLAEHRRLLQRPRPGARGTAARCDAGCRARGAAARAGSARRSCSSARSPAGPSRESPSSSVPQNAQRPASALAGTPSAAAPPAGTRPSGCFGVATVVSTPRSAAHCSQRCSWRTALFSIVVRCTTASRSWQLSQSIRPPPPAASICGQLPVLELQHAVRAAGERPVVRHDHHRDRPARAPARRTGRAAARC